MKPSEILRKLRWFWNRESYRGICTNFNDISRENLNTLMRLHKISFKDWPEFSGDYTYPVPHEEFSSERAYYDFRINKWSYFTSYGQSRRRLLKWLIREFEKKGA